MIDTGAKKTTYENILADLVELFLYLLPVLPGHGLLPLGALRLLFNGGDDAPRGPAGAHHVLVGDGQEVPLLVGQLGAGLGDGLHAGRHVVVALGLLGQLGALYQFVLISHSVWCGDLRYRVKKRECCLRGWVRICK